MKKTAYSFSPILGLALVALVLIRLGITEGMTNYLGSGASWTFFTLFGAEATKAATFLF